MPRIAVIGRHRPYSGGYLSEEPFISEGLRNAGIQVSQIDIHTLSDDDAIQHLSRYSVDVALFTHATIGRSVEFWERVSKLDMLRNRVLWTPDVILYGGRPEQYAARAPYLDLILHPEDEDLAPYGMPKSLYFCAAATPSEDSAAAINWGNKYDLTCAFFGNVYDDQRKEIVDRLTKAFGRRFKVFSLAERTGVYGANLAKICSSTKVVVGINARNNLPGYWSDRMYQIPAHGGFLIAPKVPGIEKHLTPGEHFVTYDSIESLPKYVLNWSRNDVARERIRQEGFRHVRQNHTWDQRALELVSTLGSMRMLASTGAGEQMFRVVVPVYNAEEWVAKCLQSIREQTIRNFTCVVIDDASTDDTERIAKGFCKVDPRFEYIRNESNVGALANIIRGIDVQRPNDRDVIVTVDGDDWLAHNKVLQRLAGSYRSPNTQLTYGQFLQVSSNEPGWCREYPEEVIKNRSFRHHSWVASHLRTFRYRLWRQINRDHLNDPMTGHPWAMAWDVAMMVPMLEMCEEGQYEYIPEILYIYNDGNPINDHKVDRQQQIDMDRRIRALPSYAPVVS